MGKLAAAGATAGVLGTGGAATLGAHYLGAFGGSEEKPTPQAHPKHTPFAHNDSIKELIKKDGNQCLPKIFNGWSTTWSWENIDADENLQEIEKPEDIGLGGKESDRAISCFDYSVSTGSAQEGGHFRFVWALARGNRGFAVYLSATGQGDKKVRFNGSVYVFEQGDDKKWKTAKKKNIEEDKKELSGDDLRDKFPQKNAGVSKGKSMNKYWNFLNDEGSDLRMEASKEKQWHMFAYPENGGKEEVVSWFANLDVWWSHFFGDKLGKISEVVGKNKGQWS